MKPYTITVRSVERQSKQLLKGGEKLKLHLEILYKGKARQQINREVIRRFVTSVRSYYTSLEISLAREEALGELRSPERIKDIKEQEALIRDYLRIIEREMPVSFPSGSLTSLVEKEKRQRKAPRKK